MSGRARRRARVLTPAAAEGLVRPYDFAKPEPLTQAQRQVLESAFASFARQVGLQLTAVTRTVAQVDYEAFVLVPYGALAAQLDRTSGFVLCSVDGGASPTPLVYQVPAAEALFWTSRMVGGTASGPRAPRALTAVERGLLWRVADDNLSELGIALDGLLPEVAVESFAYELPDAPADELVILVGLMVQRDGAQARLAVAVPAAPVLHAFGHGLHRQPAAEAAPLLERHVSEADVEVALRFDGTRVGPATVLALAEDDLIVLAHPADRPLVCTLDGEPVVRAAVGVNGERLACVVVEYEEAS